MYSSVIEFPVVLTCFCFQAVKPKKRPGEGGLEIEDSGKFYVFHFSEFGSHSHFVREFAFDMMLTSVQWLEPFYPMTLFLSARSNFLAAFLRHLIVLCFSFCGPGNPKKNAEFGNGSPVSSQRV